MTCQDCAGRVTVVERCTCGANIEIPVVGEPWRWERYVRQAVTEWRAEHRHVDPDHLEVVNHYPILDTNVRRASTHP